MNSLYMYVALLVLAVFIVGCSGEGNAAITAEPTASSEAAVDRVVCEEAIQAWFASLVRAPDAYETNEETLSAFDDWRDTFC